MSKQPRSIELATELEFSGRYGQESEQRAAQRRVERNGAAAAELRRLHAANAELAEALTRLIACYEVSHSPDQRFSCWRQARAAISKHKEQQG